MLMKSVFKFFVVILPFATVIAAAGRAQTVLIYDGGVTELQAPRPFPHSNDLWLTLPELTRATGFVLKPQGVCRDELCFPLPKQRKADFLAQQHKVAWFNLSEFARLVHQSEAHEEKLNAWFFGPRQDSQNSYLETLQAPEFTLPDARGKLHSLSDFRGKRVLLVTWASW
jgi:hypothetical protein